MQLWRASKSGLPESSLLHELAKLCGVYASGGDEYQEAELLVVLKALCGEQDHGCLPALRRFARSMPELGIGEVIDTTDH
ncbi:hypothetical protein ACUVZD_000216 [Pseudomonas aeruginosa]